MKKKRLITISPLSKEEKEKQENLNSSLETQIEKGEENFNIPLPFAATGMMKTKLTSLLNQNEVFGRSGLLLFTKYNNELVVFFNLFRGTDRGKRVMELSDLAGRSEPGESFVRSACYEALEESLGLFNLLGKENIVRNTSMCSYNEDHSLITIACPINLEFSPIEIVKRYAKIKFNINGPSEDLDTLPVRRMCERNILSLPLSEQVISFSFNKLSNSKPTSISDTLNDSIFSKYNNLDEASLDVSIDKLKVSEKVEEIEEIKGDYSVRKVKFNANETANIVFANMEELKILIEEKICPMSSDLDDATGGRYHNFPPLYFAIIKHVEALLPHIMRYKFI